MLSHSLSTLKSGLKVVRIPMASVRSVTVLVLCNTGSRYERPDQEGVAHFFEHMVFKGTAKYPDAHALAEVVDSVGADFNAFTSKEYTGYYVKSASRHIGLALDVVSDMLLTPQLRQDDIDREKGVIIEELNMYADTPARHIGDLFDRMMFAGSGLGHDIIGTKETITDMNAADFDQFLKTWYGMENMLVVVAGDTRIVKGDQILNQIEQMFSKEAGDRAQGKVKLENYLETTAISNQRLHVEFKETEQAHFILGWPALSRGDDRRFALSLLSTVLGGNMSSRLFTEVREKRGLCYYVHSDVDQYHNAGVFGAAAGVDPARVEEALNVTIDEFKALADGRKPVTAAELQTAKDHISGKMALNLEDSESVAQYFGMKQLLLGEIESPSQVLEKIRAVTTDQVQAVAEQLIKKDEVRLAVIGPFNEKKLFEDVLAKY